MKNRVYYGEYSLKHWIDLMLSGNIVLPEYQREFVWKTRDIKRLIKSLKSGQFIMPVTIAQYAPNGEEPRNLLLDGQQRLSSILLAWLGYEPDKSKFEESDGFASEDDSAKEENPVQQNSHKAIAWRFQEVVEFKKRKKEDLIQEIEKDGRYDKLTDIELTDDILDNTFLGFSYIVPDSKEKDDIQNNFSQLFRNINYFGKKLSSLESRKSLYYMNAELKNFFEGKTARNEECFGNIKIMEDTVAKQIDFVRFLAILSQQHSGATPLVGYSAYSSRESFYADYVSYILGIEQEDKDDKFNKFKFEETFPENCWITRYDNLLVALTTLRPNMQLNDKNAFVSWIDADYWLFGLIYHIVFEGKVLNDDVSELCNRIKSQIKKKKSEYSKTPNQLGHTRERIKESINIYQNYVQGSAL